MAQKNEAKVRINHAKTALRILFNSVALRLKAKGIYTNQYFQNTCWLLEKKGIVPKSRKDLRESRYEDTNCSKELNPLMQEVVNTIKPSGKYAIDSIRFIYQHELLKSEYKNYKTIFLDTPLEDRYNLNSERQRFPEDKAMDLEEFVKYIYEDSEEEINLLREEADFCLDFYQSFEERTKILDKYIEDLLNSG